MSSAQHNMPKTSLTDLPIELLQLIFSYLPNRDIKSARLTCSNFSRIAKLRLDRVFLSANKLNVEVFLAIADHETFRHNVVEIIWDDVRLAENFPKPVLQYWEEDLCGVTESYPGIPWWFEEAWEMNEGVRKQGYGAWDPYAPALFQNIVIFKHNLSIHDSWKFYQELLRQQKMVIASDADINAFRYGLQRFPKLKRIRICPVSHGVVDCPLYATPMIRAFPLGFNYPVQRAWPPSGHDYTKHDDRYVVQPWDQEKSNWRGFCVICKELAKVPDHNVSEFIIDTHVFRMTGLNCRIFDRPCEDYDNFVSLIRRPKLTRLDLVLFADGHWNHEWSSFRSGLLKSALSAASSNIVHFSLQVNVEYELARMFEPGTFTLHDRENLVPLCDILPDIKEKWPNLRHFGLSGLLVHQDELLKVLANLPRSVRSVELSHLAFLEDKDYEYEEMLFDIRDKLGWARLAETERPILTVHQDSGNPLNLSYACWDKAVNDFIYRGGRNPFIIPGSNEIRGPLPCRSVTPFQIRGQYATASPEILE